MEVATGWVGWIVGECWKCDGDDLLVTWVGPAQWYGQHAPIYLCEACLVAVEERVRTYFVEHPSAGPANTPVVRPYSPLPPVKPAVPDPERPATHIALSLGLGVRVTAEGRTGLTLVAAAYVLLLASAVGAAAFGLL
ncbi:hypothetical protein ACFV0R_15500 [Streptomyces sp. NPDC059578]|uniref:hypothetical protein n=1 Tax=Streptomyces sp. NPDC059578 TaxID=3346874 RepID=UPI0036BDB4F5